ncbi:hypothetical protein CMUS01_00678 [Colletotrichum musicola]|uniref:HNH nuclease domain-containing protein n=1 Tax=Colletotrichum musicola TaxID=2175873 RepID=A0A8H6U9A3_9PEZI|nr:hypothetical protein CMUS01_00678 [Colletotrichum musicola]
MMFHEGPELSTVLQNVIPHPLAEELQDDECQSRISSALADQSGYSDLWEITDRILESLVSSSGNDAFEVIKAFRETLSREGAVALMTDVKTIGKDLAKMGLFQQYLTDTVLKPSHEAPRAVKPGPPNPSSPENYPAAIARIQQQETLKQECLRRDSYRCAYCHHIDFRCAKARLVVPGSSLVGVAELCHLLPAALAHFPTNSSRDKQALEDIWFALWRYFPGLKGKVGPDEDSLEQHANLVTFAISTRYFFDDHDIAFNPLEDTGAPNRYKIEKMLSGAFGDVPPEGHREVMTLVSSLSDDDENPQLPLPEPELFRTHYQIAKILKVTGVGREIDEVMSASDWSFEDRPDYGLWLIGLNRVLANVVPHPLYPDAMAEF